MIGYTVPEIRRLPAAPTPSPPQPLPAPRLPTQMSAVAVLTDPDFTISSVCASASKISDLWLALHAPEFFRQLFVIHIEPDRSVDEPMAWPSGAGQGVAGPETRELVINILKVDSVEGRWVGAWQCPCAASSQYTQIQD